MARQLAKKLNLEAYFPFETIEEEIDWKLKQLGTSLEEMKKIGVKVFPRQEENLYLAKGAEMVFDTPSGKIELYSTLLASIGFDPLPVYTFHPEPPHGFYRLNFGRAPMHTFSRTANNPYLADLMDENVLWVNPKTAKEWSLKKDQYVYLQNQDGVVSSFSIKVRITERIRWDSVYMVHGFGHSNKKLSRAYGRGISDSELITNVMTDPVMGGTGMRGNFVTFKLNKEVNV
jgi:thiosulfate reductase/polysulfide reductase chain A